MSPIEVKSPWQYGTTSLDRFKTRFSKYVGTQYVLHPKQLRVEGDIESMLDACEKPLFHLLL